jgi:hypothetical protein
MLQTYWLALGGFATLMTLLWMFALRDELYVEAAFSTGAWGLMAFAAPDVQTLTEAGERVAASTGEPVQLFTGALAVICGLVLVLHHWDLYPVERAAETRDRASSQSSMSD